MHVDPLEGFTHGSEEEGDEQAQCGTCYLCKTEAEVSAEARAYAKAKGASQADRAVHADGGPGRRDGADRARVTEGHATQAQVLAALNEGRLRPDEVIFEGDPETGAFKVRLGKALC